MRQVNLLFGFRCFPIWVNAEFSVERPELGEILEFLGGYGKIMLGVK